MKVKWKHFKVGDLLRKNNAGKVNACLVETTEQIVAFAHRGLSPGLGQNALRQRLLVSRSWCAIRGVKTNPWWAVFFQVRKTTFAFVPVGNRPP